MFKNDLRPTSTLSSVSVVLDLPHSLTSRELAYIRALVKEVLRGHTVDPVGLPHRTTEDDWYNGYFIPKGTFLVPNFWHLSRDPDIYGPDADQFNPSRHFDKDGRLPPALADTKEEGHVSYGFGWRTCVGRHVANNALFTDIPMVPWAIKIERATDEKGEPLPMDVDGPSKTV